jgi:cyclase
MLKSRLIPCIVTKGNLVVQSYNFKRYLPIGNVKTAIEFFVNWDVDEIVILDIDATKEGRRPNVELIEWASTECFVPLTIGGGIKSIDDIKELLDVGADKVCINSVVEDNPSFITESSDVFGCQCITVSVDAVNTMNGHMVYSHCLGRSLDREISDWARMVEDLGAGEIFLNSVDRDGSRIGYDIELLKKVSSAVEIPVVACGGVGKVAHLSEGILLGGCQAAAAANIFQHTEHSTIAAKSHMLKSGVHVRLSSDVKYKNFKFDHMGRPL